MIKILKLKGLNAISIKKEKEDKMFISTNNSFIISIPSFATLIRYLVFNKIMSPKVLEGILEEYYSDSKY